MLRTQDNSRLAAVAAVIIACVLGQALHAAQVQDLVRLKGSENSKLVGMGLVIGLMGTGDGGKFLPAMRPLAQVVGQFVDPNTVAAELKDSKNVALVALSAELPATGVREGDRIDVHITSIGACKSLRGGRLFMIPMTGPLPGSPVFAYAEGPVVLENESTPTVGVIRGGAQLTRDVMVQYLDSQSRITLVLDPSTASWPMASNLANLLNDILSPDGPALAKAVDPKNIVVQLPPYERSDPAVFISRLMQAYVDPSLINTGARVVINERTGTIVVTGDVQVSPVLISHKGLTINTMTPPPVPTAAQPVVESNRFVPVDPQKRGGAKLNDLLAAFNQLKVEAHDRIAIIKQIHRSGKLHAQLIEE